MRRAIPRVLLLLGAVVGVVPTVHAEPPKDLRAAAMAALRSGLADPDRGVRCAAVQALGKAGEAPTVFAGPLRDPEWCVRQEAAWWCRKAGAASAPVLGEVIEKGTLEQKVSATWALSGVGEAAVPLLRMGLGAGEVELRIEAIAATRRLGLPAGKPLTELLPPSLKAESADERLEAAFALVTLRPGDADAAVPILEQGLAEKDRWNDRVAALLRAGPHGEASVAAMTLDNHQKINLEWLREMLADERARANPKPSLPAPAPPAPSPPPAPPTRPPAPPPFDATALRSASVFDRIDAALEVGRRGGDAALLAPLVRDPERDVRVAAAMGLGHATGDAHAPLLEAARDPRWQVQLAAVRSLGQRRAHAEIVAPFLRESVVALADAAHVALARSGAAAALPTAQQVATAHYGVLHHAPEIFEALGTDGAAAVPVLAGLLAHDDVNVRETAARCLRPIGIAAREAIPALVRALGEDRLCVLSHVALALGRTGLSEPLLAALVDPRARVRAYATFALGWALGEARNVDQVPFEVRLPVLDVGDAGPFPTAAELDVALATPPEPPDADEEAPPPPRALVAAVLRRAIRSKDPALAVRAAGALDDKELDVRDAERVMELLLPTGLRPGWPGHFDRLRSIIGSAELPACLMYLLRARVNERDIGSILGDFHRISRADNIPAILWFERVEEPDAVRENGELHMPFSRSVAFLRERAAAWLHRDPGDAPGAAALALLQDFLERPELPPDRPMLWALRDLEPTPADVPLLLRAAREARTLREAGLGGDDAWAAPTLVGLLWVLARCGDPETEAFLREVAADDGDPEAKVALAALARRGDGAAVATLVQEIGKSEWALPLLAASAPGPATRALAGRLLDPAVASSLFDVQQDWVDTTGQLGAIPLDEAFLGLEAAIAASPVEGGIGPVLRGLVAVTFPGCATRRLAEQVLAGFEAPGADPAFGEDGTWPSVLGDEPARRIVAFLHTADPARTARLLRRWAAGEEFERRRFACEALARLADREGAPLVVAFQRSLKPHEESRDLRQLGRVGGPEALAYLREVADDGLADPDERDEALGLLARASGWPADVPLDLEDFEADVREQVRAALRRGDFDTVRALAPEAEALVDGLPASTPVWKRLATAALRGDARARADFWSAQRTARYRWLHYETDPLLHTLGRDPSTLPHWLSDLDSNCCRVSDGLAQDVFEQPFAMPDLYGTESQGVAMPLSARARLWFRWSGGRFTWSPLPGWDWQGAGGFVPQAE